MTTISLGPADGRILLRTGVAGAAARMGHRLVMEFADWQVVVELDGAAVAGVEVGIAVDSLQVRSGSGGAAPLSPVDRQLVRGNALRAMRQSEHPRAGFISREVEQDGDVLQLAGDLTIAGTTRRVVMHFATGLREGRRCAVGRVPVPQSAFGVKPYSLMMGALQVADEVSVEVDLCAAAP